MVWQPFMLNMEVRTMKRWSVLFVAMFVLCAGLTTTAQAKIEVEGDAYVGRLGQVHVAWI